MLPVHFSHRTDSAGPRESGGAERLGAILCWRVGGRRQGRSLVKRRGSGYRLSGNSQRQAGTHEYPRSRASLSARTARASGPNGLGLAAVSPPRRHIDAEARELPAATDLVRSLAGLVRTVLEAADEEAAEVALRVLEEHPRGATCADKLRPHLAAALVYRRPDNGDLTRASPEWCWRDFRLRLGRAGITAPRRASSGRRWSGRCSTGAMHCAPSSTNGETTGRDRR